MTRFIDKQGHIAEISLTDKVSGIDWEQDFFEVGRLEQDEETGCYKVDDVEYLIDYANDYLKGEGDFSGDDPGEKMSDFYSDIE